MLMHLPGEASRRNMQELKIFLKLIENIVDDQLLIETVDIVGLPTAPQKNLRNVLPSNWRDSTCGYFDRPLSCFGIG